MSCVPKFDDYFNKLNMGRVKKIIVPAKSMRQLSNCLHFYQHSETRNTKGLYLSCKKIKNRKNGTDEFTVFVEGNGRWSK